MASSVQDVVDRLRGPKGTTVNISVQREGMPGLFEFSVVRDEILIQPSLCLFVRPKIGYIRIDSFTETTEDELNESLKKLGS